MPGCCDCIQLYCCLHMGIDWGAAVQLVNSPAAVQLVNSPEHAPKFGMCCIQGKVQPPPPELIPQLLHCLYTSGEPDAKAFRENVLDVLLQQRLHIHLCEGEGLHLQPCVCMCLLLFTASADTTCTCRCRWMTARTSMACPLASVSAYGARCAS